MFTIGPIKQAHEKLIRDTRKLVNKTLEAAGKEAVEHVRDKALFTHRTGRLLGSTRHRVSKTKGGGRMRIASRVRYARYLEKGTRPHLIRPRRRKSLRFWAGGRLVFARLVRHPGTRPYLFLSAARDHAFQWSRSTLQAGMRRIARSF